MIASVIGGVAAWYGGVRWQFFPRNFHTVESNFLFRSGQISAAVIGPTLDKYSIDRVIFMSNDNLNRSDIRAEIEACLQRGIVRVNYPLDGTGVGRISSYVDALTDISNAHLKGQQVLVHCHAGAQRTGGVVAFYRILIDGWSAADTRAELLAAGHDPDSNPALIPYINDNLAEVASQLAKRGVITSVPSPLPVLAEGR